MKVTQNFSRNFSRHATTWDTDSSHWMWQRGLHLCGLKHRPATGLCEYTKEPPGRMKCEEPLHWLTFTTVFSRAALFHGACYGIKKTGNENINVILKRVRVTTVAAERMCVCSLSHPERKAHALYYAAICGLSDSTIFHITSKTAPFSKKSYWT